MKRKTNIDQMLSLVDIPFLSLDKINLKATLVQ